MIVSNQVRTTFNLTSKQTIAVYSFNGEPVVVIDLGYVKNFEFVDSVLIEVPGNDLITMIDGDGITSLIHRDSIIHQACMLKVKESQLMFETTLGMV